jgi:predicted methyltransferase
MGVLVGGGDWPPSCIDMLNGECSMKMVALAVAMIGCLPVVSAAWAQAVPSYVSAAVASPGRPKADTDRDAMRHPGELIAFAGLKPGDRVAELMPGQGYFTRLFSKVVGPQGHIYAVIPAELAKLSSRNTGVINALAHEPGFGNVTLLVQPTAEIAPPEPLDLAWTSDNYHDIYGFFGAEHAAALDAAVFKALKPGGVFIVIDHVAKAGTSDTSPKGLHRIDPATVKAQVLAAGFRLEGESSVLANPADTHDVIVFSPTIRGRTDQFVMKFRKPG